MAKSFPASKKKTHLQETLDVLSDPVLMDQIVKSQAFYRASKKGLAFEDVFDKPVTPARKQRHHPVQSELTARLRKKA